MMLCSSTGKACSITSAKGDHVSTRSRSRVALPAMLRVEGSARNGYAQHLLVIHHQLPSGAIVRELDAPLVLAMQDVASVEDHARRMEEARRHWVEHCSRTECSRAYQDSGLRSMGYVPALLAQKGAGWLVPYAAGARLVPTAQSSGRDRATSITWASCVATFAYARWGPRYFFAKLKPYFLTTLDLLMID